MTTSQQNIINAFNSEDKATFESLVRLGDSVELAIKTVVSERTRKDEMARKAAEADEFDYYGAYTN